ncbi:MAG: protein kinase, partial [Eubacteriales bacterium]|nr:protein kinase [Eubacteriales bacterium]
FIEWNGGVYTVMDYIPGYSFQEYLKRGTKFKEQNVREWAIQLCETLKYLHGQRRPIIHSDIKPGNIMLTPEGNIALIDFNISTQLSGMGAIVTGATPGYAPPEQIQALKYNKTQRDVRQWRTVDARADLYSLGASLYCILTGKKAMIQPNGYILDIRSLRPDLNDVFASIIMKCLNADPNARYQTAEELLYDLNNIYVNDRQYTQLLKKQNRIYIGTLISVFFFAALIAIGYFKMDIDSEDRYQMLIHNMEADIDSGNYGQIEDYFQDARKENPSGVDAWYYRALAYYQDKDFAGCIDFVENNALRNRKLQNSSEKKDALYYLVGESYFGLNKFEDAAVNYQKAIDEEAKGEYYRELAIAYSWNGQPQEAEEALRRAEDFGLASEELNFVHAEMKQEANDAAAAKELYLTCLSANNKEIQQRAYLGAAACLDILCEDEASQEGYRTEQKNILEQGVEALPDSTELKQKLSKTYYELGRLTGEKDWYAKSAETYKTSYTEPLCKDYLSLSDIYRSGEMYDEAAAILKEARSKWNRDYRVYMHSAQLERDIQNREDNYANRDYTIFENYYQSAENYYAEWKQKTGKTDADMENLERAYEELRTQNLVS